MSGKIKLISTFGMKISLNEALSSSIIDDPWISHFMIYVTKLCHKLCSRRRLLQKVHNASGWNLTSHKPQYFFVFSCFTKKWANSVTFLIGRFPLNRQIFKLDHEWRILIKEELNLNIFHPPFCPTAAEILHQPPSLPPHPPPICLTPIFLQFKGWTLPKLQNSLYMSQVQN